MTLSGRSASVMPSNARTLRLRELRPEHDRQCALVLIASVLWGAISSNPLPITTHGGAHSGPPFPRQMDGEGGAHAKLALSFQVALILIQNGSGNGQPQPHALRLG